MTNQIEKSNMKLNYIYKSIVVVFLSIAFVACEEEFFPAPPKAKSAKETTTLEATFVATPPITLSDAYWKIADYLKVPVIDLNKNLLYPNGYLNMTGTYNGLTSFNAGANPNVIMKAAYDNAKMYLYVEWTDNDLSPASFASILNGPVDPLKSDTAGGWTTQENSDKFSIAFDINNATSSAGAFSNVGCAASCHSNSMQTLSGSVDLWNWDLATSEALGYAHDWSVNSATGIQNDAGNIMAILNKSTSDARTAPIYEWNGVEQIITRPDGKSTTLDPGYYLYNKTAFIGDIVEGKTIYHNAVYGCNHCHGDFGEGNGPFGDGTAFASVGFASKYSRAAIKSFSSSELHTGKPYWSQVPVNKQDDLIAFIKGMGSLPGFTLTAPDGSAADVWSVSNVTRSRLNTIAPHTQYKVILVRNLVTSNADDAQFNVATSKTYPFGIALMDADSKNHIGSLKQILTFK